MKKQKYYKNLLLLWLLFACLSCLNFSVVAQKLEPDKAKASLTNLENRKLPRPTEYDLAKDWDLFQFKLTKIRYLQRYYKPSPALSELADNELKIAETLSNSLEKKNASPIKTGVAEEAYFDDTDGSVQPFIRYLPGNYDKEQKYPLIVYLHGYSPYLNIVNWTTIPTGLEELAENLDACMVMPFARSNTDFQGNGEQDVLNAIEQMKKRYNIDENRIFLTGMSMGGMGVWTIGSHYPHLFAGLVILSGRGDFYFWHKLDSRKMPEYQQYLIDKEFAVSHLPNLKRIPIRVFHGDQDTLIPLAEARHMRDLLSSAKNFLFNYKEVKDGDHWIHQDVFGDSELIEWMRQTSRKTPVQFSFNSYHPSYNRAYWLYVNKYTANTQPANIQVKVRDTNILIRTLGVKELIIDREKMPERMRKFTIVKQNEFDLKEIPGYKNPKKPFPWGPIKDAFLEPFVFVDAGARNEAGKPMIQQRAFEWYKFTKSFPRVKAEKELSEKDKSSFNLFLFGEPESSPMIREVLKNSPIKVTAEEYIVGPRKYPRKNNGLYFQYQSPWNPAKSVVIQCGIPWGKSCSPNHIYDFLPGYIVYASEADPGDPFGGNKALEGGYFDFQGKID